MLLLAASTAPAQRPIVVTQARIDVNKDGKLDTVMIKMISGKGSVAGCVAKIIL